MSQSTRTTTARDQEALLEAVARMHERDRELVAATLDAAVEAPQTASARHFQVEPRRLELLTERPDGGGG